MRRKGITYDTGFFPAGRSSRPTFEPEQARYEMDVIADELRCDAVRATGGDLDRLSIAGQQAAAAGLERARPPRARADARVRLAAPAKA